MTHVMALTLGDRYGIGPEIVAQTLSSWNFTDELISIVVGDRDVFEAGCSIAGVDVRLTEISSLELAREAGASPLFLHLPFPAPLGPPGRVSAVAGREVVEVLSKVAEAVRSGVLDGLVYAPLNKRAMVAAGYREAAETQLFSRLFGREAAEINVVDGLATSRVTSHVPVSLVAAMVTSESVSAAIARLWTFLRNLGLEQPRLAVAGLNPHAGEGGVFGREEVEVIEPAIAAARRTGITVSGPFPPDTVFPQAIGGEFDGVVTMYHDQGQIALKLIGLGRGVTVIEGLGVPIVTPAHGTAFDIVGKGVANSDGLNRALVLCRHMMSGSGSNKGMTLDALMG